MQAAMGEAASGERKAGSNSLVPLDTLGGLARASIAAGDKALDKAEQHYKSAGLYLAEAKERVARTKNLTWPAYLGKHCPIGRRQADLYIEMAEGRTTLAEVNERARTSMAASRAKKSAQRCAQSDENHQQEQRAEEPCDDCDNAEQRWERSLGNVAGDAISLCSFWTREFGEQWEIFEVPSTAVTLAKQAAKAWTELAADLTKRRKGALN